MFVVVVDDASLRATALVSDVLAPTLLLAARLGVSGFGALVSLLLPVAGTFFALLVFGLGGSGLDSPPVSVDFFLVILLAVALAALGLVVAELLLLLALVVVVVDCGTGIMRGGTVG